MIKKALRIVPSLLAIAIVLTPFARSYLKQKPFSPNEWRTPNDTEGCGYYTTRRRMLKSLPSTKPFEGLEREGVEKLLGPPEQVGWHGKCETCLIYTIGPHWWDTLDNSILIVELNEKKKVVSYEVART